MWLGGFWFSFCGVVSLFATIVAKVHLPVLCQRLTMCQALCSSELSPQYSSAGETWPLPRMFCSGHWSMTRQLTQDYVLVAVLGERKKKGASTYTWTLWLGIAMGRAMQIKGSHRNDRRRRCSEQLVLINFPRGGSRAHSVISIFVSLEESVWESSERCCWSEESNYC